MWWPYGRWWNGNGIRCCRDAKFCVSTARATATPWVIATNRQRHFAIQPVRPSIQKSGVGDTRIQNRGHQIRTATQPSVWMAASVLWTHHPKHGGTGFHHGLHWEQRGKLGGGWILWVRRVDIAVPDRNIVILWYWIIWNLAVNVRQIVIWPKKPIPRMIGSPHGVETHNYASLHIAWHRIFP